MIKGAGRTAAGVPVLFLGLSGENVTRLAAGEPIAIRPAELAAMGLPVMEVVLAYGQRVRLSLRVTAWEGELIAEGHDPLEVLLPRYRARPLTREELLA